MSELSPTPRLDDHEERPDEPPSPTAPAPARGQSLLGWLKGLFALRSVSLRDDIEVALEAEQSGETADFSPAERTILQNVLRLGDKRVGDVMVPRADIVALDADCSLGELVALFRRAGHSRIPLYDENIDNITGFVHVKDALRRITEVVSEPGREPVKFVSSSVLRQKIGKLDIARPVLFVPPLMPVGELLQQMQQKRLHMAIVIDEYGGTDGVLTIEDLLEAVVGEIDDEHDVEDGPLIRKINSNIFIASARAELGEVEEVIGPDFDPGEHADEVDTLGGLVFALAGHVPVKGEVIGGIRNFDFEVLQADSRQLRRIKIRRLKQRKPPAPKPDAPPAAPAP